MFRQCTDRVSAWVAQRHDHHYLGRYSIVKLQQFDEYQRTTSWRRVIAVLLLTPLPTMLALVAMDVVPMNHPSAGPSQNAIAFVRSTLSHALMTFVTLLPLKQALSLSDRHYSMGTIAVIACCAASTVEAVCIPLAFTWRFPVPFREMIGLPMWTTSVCIYNYIFAKRTIRRLWRQGKLQLYVPIVGVQIVLFYGFLGLSVGFAYLDLVPQTAMIVLFPFVKISLKHLVWKYARALDDISTDVSICMLEVSGSLYQTVCLQFVTSHTLSVAIMVTDFLQAFHEVHSYMKMDYLGDGRRTLATAITIVESAMEKDSAKLMAMSTTVPCTSVVPSDTEDPPPSTDGDEAQLAPTAPPLAKRRSMLRQSSTELIRAVPITRQASTESLRSVLTRKSSLESIGIARQSSHESLFARSSEDDPSTQRSVRRERRARSVYVHPAVVRQGGATRQRRRSRRLLDLDRFAIDVAGLHSTTENAEGDDDASSTVQPVCDYPVVSKKIPVYISPRSTAAQEWMGRLTHRRRSPLRTRSSKIYAVHDAMPRSESPRTQSPVEHDTPRWQSQDDPLRFMEIASLASDRSARPTSARTCIRKRARGLRIDGVHITRRHQARVLEQTLQLLFVCEVLLFAEYMEVVIPVLYACVLGGEWLLPNAAYNVVVNTLTGAQAVQQVWTSLLYALLELASMLAMYYVMRRRYGVSAFVQLAFVLETYWMTLQGKLVGSFIVVMNALTIHQGANAFANL